MNTGLQWLQQANAILSTKEALKFIKQIEIDKTICLNLRIDGSKVYTDYFKNLIPALWAY